LSAKLVPTFAVRGVLHGQCGGFPTANLKKLNEVGGKVKYCIEFSNRFTSLEDLDAEVQTNSAWGTIRKI
jgi:hypothetical protein